MLGEPFSNLAELVHVGLTRRGVALLGLQNELAPARATRPRGLRCSPQSATERGPSLGEHSGIDLPAAADRERAFEWIDGLFEALLAEQSATNSRERVGDPRMLCPEGGLENGE